MKTFAQIMASAKRKQKEREHKAGKHKCVRVCSGVARRVTRKDGEPLKRPVVVARFYECRICGKNM